MKSIVEKVRSQRLFGPGERVVVAVSGGADSVALLDVLTRLEEERLELVVAHLNHSLRGADSDADEEFVASLAARHRLPFVARRTDVALLAAAERLSLEDAGRRARHAFLREVAQEHDAGSIALAHHLDDQAETFLIRLLRGSGGSGLGSMSSVSGILKRPLLQVTRAEIEGYLKGLALSWRTDASNADTAILRNSIRHQLIPSLRTYNPKISQRLAATAEILSCDEELLEEVTATAYARLAEEFEGVVRFDLEQLLTKPRGLRFRLYRRALATSRGDLLRIALAHLEAIDRLAAAPRPNAALKLPGECRVTRCYQSLNFSAALPEREGPWEVEIAGEGSHRLPGNRALLVQRVPHPETLAGGSPLVAHLDADAVPFPWRARSFTPGDRFTPLGMTGTRKVKELFIDEKIPPHERNSVPLLLSGGEILWVAGVRLAERGRVTAATGAVLRVEILEFTP